MTVLQIEPPDSSLVIQVEGAPLLDVSAVTVVLQIEVEGAPVLEMSVPVAAAPGGGGGGVTDGNKGDITASGGGVNWTINDGAVTDAKIVSVGWGKLTGIPASFPPSPHGHPAVEITGLAAVATSGSASDLGAGTLPAARFTDTSHGNRAGGALHAAATPSVAGFMSGADKTKLDGIATGATANATDAALRDRSTHTGTQPASTISNFAATVIASVLTSFAAAGTRTAIVATDTILAAFGKVQKYLNDLSALAFSGSASDLSGTKTAAFISDFAEAVDDRVAALAVAGPNMTITYDDALGTLTFASTGGGGATDLSYVASTRTLESSTGADVVLPLADITNPGLMARPEAGPSRFFAFNDFVSNTSDAAFLANQIGGTGSSFTLTTSPTDGGIGWLTANVGTTATGRAGVGGPNANLLQFGLGRAIVGGRARILKLANVTDDWIFYAGFMDSLTAEPQDGAYFRYNFNVNGGRFQAITRNNNVETAVDTTITVAVNTTYRFRVDVNAAGTEAQFFIDDVLLATITTNIPTASARTTGWYMNARRTAGTVALSPCAYDYMWIEQLFTGR